MYDKATGWRRPGQRRLTTILLAALLGTAAALGTVTSTAVAATCPSGGNFCLWQDAGYGGGMYFHDGRDSNLHNDNFATGVPVGDNASSLHNFGDEARRLDDVRYFRHTGWSGESLCIVNTTGQNQVENLRNLPLSADNDRGSGPPSEPDGTWNDDISSFRWIDSC